LGGGFTFWAKTLENLEVLVGWLVHVSGKTGGWGLFGWLSSSQFWARLENAMGCQIAGCCQWPAGWLAGWLAGHSCNDCVRDLLRWVNRWWIPYHFGAHWIRNV
jgi:hypothetical protein